MTTACTPADISCLAPVKRGDTWRFQFTWEDEDGSPLHLGTATIKMQIRNQRTSALVAEADRVELGSEGNVVTALFLPETTRSVAPGTYHTDMEVAFTTEDVLSSATLALPVLADFTYT